MKAIQIISQDVFDKVRSRFQNLEMGDETGAVTLDPTAARFFDFDFVYEGANLGRISISLADAGSLKIYYSQGITEDQDDVSKQIWYNFLKEMRMFAMRRLLRFDTRDIAKTNLDKNDFQHLAATQAPKEEDAMKNTMNESRWTRNTPKTSRAVKGGTQIIVRYKESMEGVHPSLRSNKKYIQGIYVENNLGERFKYPFEHLDGALAMGMHVEHGGVPYDAAGKAIIGMSEEIAKLHEFQKLVHSATLHDDANQIKERAVGRLQELKAKIKALSKRHHYESWLAEFNEQEQMDDSFTMDDVTMEEYKAKFTQTNFIENLTDYFPLLHKIMSEANKVDLDEYVSEEQGYDEVSPKSASYILRKLDQGVPMSSILDDFPELSRMMDAIAHDHGLHPDDDFEQIEDVLMNDLEDIAAQDDDFGDHDPDEDDMADQHGKGYTDEFAKFEDWAESVVEGQLSSDQVQALADYLGELQTSGQKLTFDTAYDVLNQYGIEDENLKKQFDELAKAESTVDPLEVFRDWAEKSYPDLLPPLANVLPQRAEQPAAPAEVPVEPQPQAQPPQAETTIPPVRGTATVHGIMPAENDERDMGPGTMAAEDKQQAVIQKIAEMVKSRFNASNPNVGPFNGHEGILIDVKKEISEMFGEEMGERARVIAEKFMAQLEQKWMAKHGEKLEMERMKKLAGLR